MTTDAKTQRDLEIFQARGDGPGIASVMDRTVTRSGRRRLNEMLGEPLRRDGERSGRLRLIFHLHATRFRLGVSDDLLRAVEEYLASSFSTVSGESRIERFGDASWVALKHRDLLRHARSGIRHVGHMVQGAYRTLESLENENPPDQLTRMSGELGVLLQRLQSILAKETGPYWAALEVDRQLRHEAREDLERVLEIMAELDAASALARLLDEGYALPTVGDGGETHLEGVGLWHPFLPDGVRNPVSLRGGETLVFLTGPNMAGKTTYLKAVGVCIYLSQCGVPVPAASFSCAPVDRLITGLSPEDNLREGVSYFLAEVRRVKEVVAAVARGQRTIAIFDEVFRGTNVTDALDASRTVLLGCARARTSIFVFSSHLMELAEDLQDRPSVKFCFFEGDLEGSELRFDYRLRTGVSNQRFGMEVLRREGVPDLLDAIRSSSVE